MKDTRRRYTGRVAFMSDRHYIEESTGFKLYGDRKYKFVAYGTITDGSKEWILYHICDHSGAEFVELENVDFLRCVDPSEGQYFVLNSIS